MAGKTLPTDMAGKRFGCLTVIERNGNYPKTTLAAWRCRCDCGGETTTSGSNLRRGAVTSCGCRRHRNAMQTKHGKSNTLIYARWVAMIERCTNRKNHSYHRYGGRGIRVCERWMKFENFYADMGEPPPGMTLDRIDNDGNYERSNCRWASRLTQANNTRHVQRARRISTSIGQMSIRQAAAHSGVCVNAIHKRLESGVTGDSVIAPKQKPWSRRRSMTS